MLCVQQALLTLIDAASALREARRAGPQCAEAPCSIATACITMWTPDAAVTTPSAHGPASCEADRAAGQCPAFAVSPVQSSVTTGTSCCNTVHDRCARPEDNLLCCEGPSTPAACWALATCFITPPCKRVFTSSFPCDRTKLSRPSQCPLPATLRAALPGRLSSEPTGRPDSSTALISRVRCHSVPKARVQSPAPPPPHTRTCLPAYVPPLEAWCWLLP